MVKKKKNLWAKTSAAIFKMVGCFSYEYQVKAAAPAPAGGELPAELIYDILARLPVKSVGRFRCVSKHWQTLLSDPQFLKIQFTRNDHQTKVILLQDYSFLSIDLRNNCSRKKFNNKIDLVGIYETLSFKPNNFRYTIRGSCNGLILLYGSDILEVAIANPITHESRQLPAFPIGIQRHYCKFGFGYSSYDDEYTVVLISDHTCISPVYMLKRNLWKRVGNSPLGIDSFCGTFVNGAIHWICSWDLGHSRKIYAFDLAGERFREVEQPKGFKKDDGFLLDILGGCLCLVVRHKNLATDIWVMKEYGVRESWTKYVVCSSQDYRNIQPLFFWNGDESIVAVGQWRLVLCHLKQETLASIPVIGDGTPKHFYGGMWTFVDSLFSPNSSNAVDGPNQIQV